MTLPMDGSALEISEAGDVELSPPNREVSFHLAPPSSPVDASTVRSGPRVGVSGVGGSMAFPWRFWCAQNSSVSAYRPGKNVPGAG
ncbi:hypothetical protein [Nesterenkonia massiliensis]|uniref:hypothetical protein n=1 Tax=Nesterenkonia massiliensis TaxID=1232429 RepID=UPI003B8A6481